MFKSNFWIKLKSWEYWPWYIIYIPIFVYWLWCGIKARSILYISAVNPGFDYGGIIGASKMKILQKIPEKYLPLSLLADSSTPLEKIMLALQQNNLRFPVIVKPDIGERGYKVELIQNETALKKYLSNVFGNVIIQEYIDQPIELGVFYYRIPEESQGVISSIVEKGFLKVAGDGESTIEQLMLKNERARLQVKRLKASSAVDLIRVPERDEVVRLEPIGNHVRGTTFLDGNHLISKELIRLFDNISEEIEGYYYGRFDLRCENMDSLYRGEFKILELNGAASEPAHIYSPGFSLREGYRVLFYHWRTLYKISKTNHARGIPYMTIRDAIKALRKSRFRRE